MELMVSDLAARRGLTPRQVRRAIADGQLSALRRVGRQLIVDDIAATVWARSTGHGSTWRPRTREAALDLLSYGSTDRLDGSSRSRLKRSLRQMSTRAIAHAAGGLGGGWGRYRAEVSGGLIGPSAVDAASLGIVDGQSWLQFVETDDLDQWELANDAVLDADGPACVVERATGDSRIARLLIDSYLLGDDRVSAAASTQIQECAHAL